MIKLHEQEHRDFMNMAMEEARSGMLANEGGSFGAIIVRSGEVIAKAHNQVLVLC